MFIQIFFGSGLLVLCALMHVTLIAQAIPALTKLNRRTRNWSAHRRASLILSTGLAFLLFFHTVQIWLWAICISFLNGFDHFSESFYFAIATYTTLGYGDIVLGESMRIFASFAAIAGLLSFGFSTAFLIALITRFMPAVFSPQK